jgi:hypothetical protein
VDVCLWLDVVVNFRTGYTDDRREVHMAPMLVAARYLRTWCLIDVLSVFPFRPLAVAVMRGADPMCVSLRVSVLPKHG